MSPACKPQAEGLLTHSISPKKNTDGDDDSNNGPTNVPKKGVAKKAGKKNARPRKLSPTQIKSLEQMVDSRINSEASTSTTFSTVVKDPNDVTTGTVGPEMDVDVPTETIGHEMDVDIPVSAPDAVVEDPDVETPMSAPEVVVSAGTVDPELDAETRSCAPDGASTEATDLDMPDVETPASNSFVPNTSISSQEHATVQSSGEASTSTTSSSHHPNIPFTLIHVWEDQYTRENTSNLTDTQPRGPPDNMVAIPTHLFQEFLSLLTLHGRVSIVPNVPSTAVAEEPSSNASNTPRRARSRSAVRSVLRFAPGTPLSPILEESPNAASKSPTLDRLIKEADARRNSTSRAQVDASETDVVVEPTLPGSGSTPSVVMDSMTASASGTVLREQKSPKTVLQILEGVVAESHSKTKVDSKCKKLIHESTGQRTMDKPATPCRESDTPRKVSFGVRSDGSSFGTPYRLPIGLSAREQRMLLHSEITQTYDDDGNLILPTREESGPGLHIMPTREESGPGLHIITDLGKDDELYDSGDEGLGLLAHRNKHTRPNHYQLTENTETPQPSTENAAASEPNTEATNQNQEIAAGQTQIPQAPPQVANGQLILTTPTPTTPRRGYFGSFLNSARSVSKFIPGFGASSPAQPTGALPVIDITANANTSGSRQLALPAPENANTAVSRQLALPVPQNTTPSSTRQTSRTTQTEPRRRAPATAGSSHGARTVTAPRTFRTSKDMEESRRTNVAREARRRKQQEDAEREEEIEMAKKAAEDLRKEEKKAAVPGKKRKRPRAPSPDVIPNPPGCSYGMHPDYFGSSSSEEDDEDDDEDIETPTRKGKQQATRSDEEPRSKRAKVTEEHDETEAAADHGEQTPRGRTSYRVYPEPFSHVVIGDPRRARPYTGTVCPLPSSNPSLYHGGNVFEQADTAKEQADAAKKAARSTSRSPSRSPSINTFTVPDWTDSEDEDEEESVKGQDREAASETPKPAKTTDVDVTTPKSANSMVLDTPTPKSVATMDMSTATPQQAEDPNAANIAYWDKLFNSPTGMTNGLDPVVSSSAETPSRPSSSIDGTLPANTGAKDTGALARARSQALKYTPKQPSGLRAQSRLSTSTTASDVGENADEVIGVSETPAASQSSSQPAEGQEGDGNAIVAQESAMGEGGKEGEQQGGAGMTVGGGQQQLSGWVTEGMDEEVRAAIAAIAEDDLVQFAMPPMRSYAEQGLMDPEVEAYLRANWTEADTARAERSFEANFEAWAAEQRFMTSAAP